ncbi:MAG TPA: DegT/DnrJ/EryC1/StrS family aminotransferase, partial [Cyclobacteriaceae bacterium]
YYFEKLQALHTKFNVDLPVVPYFSEHNAHIFYVMCNSGFQRDYLIKALKKSDIQASFHYPPLHLSKYNLQTNEPRVLPNSLKFAEQLIRIPLYVELTKDEQDYVMGTLTDALSNFSASPEYIAFEQASRRKQV